MATVTGTVALSATAGLTVVAGQMHVVPPVDGTVGLKPVVGTCAWCGQANIVLSSHMGGHGVRYLCTSATGPFIDPNQSPLPANMKGAAGYLHR